MLGSWFAADSHPAAYYQSINPIFNILLSPVFAWLWVEAGRRNLEPSAPAKFALGLMQLALGFVVIMFAAKLAIESQVAPAWLLITYLLHTTGELCLSPIGLSAVTKLSPPRYVGPRMGTWCRGAALVNLIAGIVGGRAAVDVASMPGSFLRMALIGGGAGVVLLLFSRVLKNMMGGVK